MFISVHHVHACCPRKLEENVKSPNVELQSPAEILPYLTARLKFNHNLQSTVVANRYFNKGVDT